MFRLCLVQASFPREFAIFLKLRIRRTDDFRHVGRPGHQKGFGMTTQARARSDLRPGNKEDLRCPTGPYEKERVCPLHVEKSAWNMQAETLTLLA